MTATIPTLLVAVSLGAAVALLIGIAVVLTTSWRAHRAVHALRALPADDPTRPAAQQHRDHALRRMRLALIGVGAVLVVLAIILFALDPTPDPAPPPTPGRTV